MRKTHSTARRLMGALRKDLPLPQRLREGLRVVLEQPGMAGGAQAALFLDTEAGPRRVAETGSPPGGWGLEPGTAEPPEGCRQVPLRAGGRRIGLLVLYSPGSGETPDLEPALDEAAGLLAAALAWARQTQRQAALLALGAGEAFLLDARGRPVLVHGTPANPGPFPEWGAEAAAFFWELLEHPLQSHGRVLRLGKRWVSVRGCNLLPDPLVAGVALTVADVTEKAQAERAREVLSRVADLLIRAGEETPFLAGVCHLLVEAGYGLAWAGWARPGFAVEQVAAAGATAYLEGLEVTWDEGPTGQGPSGQALRTGRPALMRFIRDDPAYAPWRERALAHGFESSLGLPVEVGGRALGVLSLYAPEPDAFSAEELGLLERLAALVGRRVEFLRQRAETHKLSQVVEQEPEPVLITDLQGRIVYANPAVEAKLGYSREELLGQNPRLFRSGQHPKEFYADLWQTLGSGEVFRAQFVNRRKDGSLVREDKILFPLHDRQGGVVGYASVGRDVTREEELVGWLGAVLRAVPVPVVGLDETGRVTLWNPAAESTYGYGVEEVLGQPLPIVGEREEDFNHNLARLAAGETLHGIRVSAKDRGGSLIPSLLYAAPLERGSVRALVDIRPLLALEQELAFSLRLWQDLLEFTNQVLSRGVARDIFQAVLQRAVSHIPGAQEGHLFLRDPDEHYRHVARVGPGSNGLKGLWVEPEGLRVLELGAAVGWVQEPALSLEPMLYARIEAEGEVFGVLYLGGPVSPAASGVAGLFAAQMALWLRWQQSQEEVSFLAYHDSLTGLPNRRRLREEVSICQEGPGGVVLIDLDGFKAVNDTLGHAAGDRLLQETASRLRAALPPEGRIFRMGGDEFAALLPGPPEEVTRALEQMRRAMEPPVVLDSKLVRISFSAGIAYCPLDGQDLSTLLGRADLALYRAKGQPTRTAFYDQALEAALYRRQDLLMALSHALAEGELLLHFQPIVGLENQQPVAYEALEALVRWPGGPAPAVFIPLAEETGLVKELDRYVLTRVAALAQGRTVSVNLSVQSLTDAGFVAFLAGLPNRENVVLEITERVLAHPETFAALQEVAELGFRLALDDFGSGYSSLGYLARMPFYALKVDRLFTQGIGENPRAEAVLRAVRDLARNLGLAVVVEGVETDAQRGWLLAEGFAWGQGFLFGRPAPMESFGGAASPPRL
ncbi:EAL domain-containing protein [Calidithermus chliarophilus]|uniref:bifunctional diguanylate cyclase/phosphodiesterase n=1 Tax=Calidithermus chliarophilus TaxID=52023 RepID=UPI0004129808|nr:EAL domain-containing protein [Calidithermus chliarophilus]